MKSRHSRRTAQSGVIILEALVSVVLFAIGLLALVAVASQAMHQVSQSKYRNDAAYLAGELIGDMWVSAARPNVYDHSAWDRRVTTVLGPAATAALTFSNDPATGQQTVVTIEITWPDSKDDRVTHRYLTTATIAKNP